VNTLTEAMKERGIVRKHLKTHKQKTLQSFQLQNYNLSEQISGFSSLLYPKCEAMEISNPLGKTAQKFPPLGIAGCAPNMREDDACLFA